KAHLGFRAREGSLDRAMRAVVRLHQGDKNPGGAVSLAHRPGPCAALLGAALMASTVLLIRHPESAWNRKGIYQGQRDIPLSPLGRVQAELVAARLMREHVVGVVCSPLRRARALAQAIARYHHLAADPDERLIEISH